MEHTAWTTPGVYTGPEGVLTDQGGTLFGELTVHTVWEAGEARVEVRYEDGGEWYDLSGSPVACPDPQAGRSVHQSAVEAVRAGGPVGFTPWGIVRAA
ncbi:hypothetical protein LG634_03045 [Streptomyces bambusae]|uniref:hypothetical protein n=1 Tax=Streptomyces bambusae TaxID=1550616 RepID=UPI001CFF42AA|nr:hypothetical protein [Streptomyces bambusae]MCB5163819.1 hypothetical protein [Streptomyces bambusae]